MFIYKINTKAELVITDECILDELKKEKLKEILNLYVKNYPEYLKWEYKSDYYDKENLVRTNIDLDEYREDNIHIGYLKDKYDKIILDDNYIKFMFLRYSGLQNCICKLELYLEYNKEKDTCFEQKYLDFFKKELKKLEFLIMEYEEKKHEIDSYTYAKINFIKKLCETINWGFDDNFSTCEEILKMNNLHPKTFGDYKQRVLGSNNLDWIKFKKCNRNFEGEILMNYERKSICNKTVIWNMLLNKYATLSSYYKQAPFIRFLLIDGLIMPHRRYPPFKKEEIKGNNIGKLNFGPYNFNIYINGNKFELYDETNFKILYPYLRSSTTITYTEFRDLLCYLNLFVFRSIRNKSILFFPNYDMHQRLLEIQGLPRNYSTYTGRSIEWKWFDEYEIKAKEAITCVCQEYEESPGYGIEPVEYVWYEIVFKTGNAKKYIFLVCSWEEYMTYYRKSEFLIKKTTPNKLYVYNDVIRDHAVAELTKAYELERVNYVWYEINLDDYTTKEYLFIRCLNEELQTYYSNLKYLRKLGNNYVYDYEIEAIALVKLREQHRLYDPLLQSRWHEKYLKYKKKYLELKSKYLELKSKN
jgi:hypothetical protein